MKRDDTLWKAILENVFDDFLRFFFPDADEQFDMSKGFQFLDKELNQLFPAEELKEPKSVDKLVKVFTHSGKEQWMLLHIEVQGYLDKHFSERMFIYFYRIFERYRKPVTAIAILTDNYKSFRPSAFHYDFMGTSFTYTFNMYKIRDQDEKQLLDNPNPFAMIVCIVLLALKKGKLSEDELLKEKLSLARALLNRKIPIAKVRSLMTFLKYYVHFEDEKNNANFEEALEVITKNSKNMGIEEFLLDRAKKQGIEEGLEKGIKKGIEQGIEQGKSDVVKNLLRAGKFSISEIANFAGVTESFVRKVKRSLK